MIATEADLARIVEVGRTAHAASAWVGLAEFDPASFEASCRSLMADENALVLFNGTASLWVKRFPLYFNHAETVVHEVFFAGTNGRPLRKAAEQWAKGDLITMSRNANTRASLEAAYRRAGYVPIESTFIRRAG